mgnify:CR=1 FL=1
MFNQPQSESNGSYFPTKEYLGDLILFHKVLEAGSEFNQMAGKEVDYRIVEYTNLDGDQDIHTAKVANAYIVSKLPVDGSMILGRIGTAKTKNGYTAFILEPHKPEDVVKAEAWVKAGRKPSTNPGHQLEAEAKKLGVDVKTLLALKKLNATEVSDDPGF